MKNINIGITLGLWWLSTFDKSQFLFKSMKILPFYIRYLFYISLVGALPNQRLIAIV